MKKRNHLFAVGVCILALLGSIVAPFAIPIAAENEPEPQDMPTGFLTGMQLLKEVKEGTKVPFSENDKNVSRDADCVLWFDYTIPDPALVAGTPYKMVVAGNVTLAGNVPFTITAAGVTVASGTASPGVDGGVDLQLAFSTDVAAAPYLMPGTTGNFYVEAKLDAAKIPNSGRQNLSLSSNGNSSEAATIDFAVTPIAGSVTLSKNNDTTTYLNFRKILWTLTATPTLTNAATEQNHLNSFTVTDTLPDGLTFLLDDTLAQNPGMTAENFSVNGQVITIAMPLSAGQAPAPVTVTLLTSYDPAKIAWTGEGETSFTNTATAAITFPQYKKDPDTGKAAEDIEHPGSATTPQQATSEAQLTGASLTKEGVMLAGGTVKWTVTATNGMDFADPYFLDTLPENTVLITDDASYPVKLGNTSLEKATDEPGQGQYQYTQDLPGTIKVLLASGTEEQTLTYYTRYTGGGELPAGSRFLNTIELYAGTKPGRLITKTASVSPGDALMAKTGVYHPSSHTIDWTITLKTEGAGLTGSVILTDTFGAGPVQNLTGDVKLNGNVIKSGLATSSSGMVLTLSEQQIALINAQNCTISYTTTLADSEDSIWAANLADDTVKAENGVKLQAGNLPGTSVSIAAKTPIVSTVLEKSGRGYNYVDHVASWEITVNKNQMELQSPVVTDTLPDTGWHYVEDSLAVKQGDATLVKGETVAAGVYTVEYGTQNGKPGMTIHLPDMAQDAPVYKITYKTAPDSYALLATNDTLTVRNTAKLTGEHIPENTTASAANTIDKKILSKTNDTSTFGTDCRIKWNIVINQNLARVDGANGAAVAIEDTLENGLMLEESTLVVEKLAIAADGTVETTGATTLTKGTDYTVQYNASTRVLKVTFCTGTNVPDATHLSNAYRIRFATLVLTSGSYGNTAKYADVPAALQLQATQSSWAAHFGGGWTQAGLGAIDITETDESGALLAGATFTVRDAQNTIIGSFITDSTAGDNGQNLEILLPATVAGTQYVLEQTLPPEGYALPETAQWTLTVKQGRAAAVSVENEPTPVPTATPIPSATSLPEEISSGTDSYRAGNPLTGDAFALEGLCLTGALAGILFFVTIRKKVKK